MKTLEVTDEQYAFIQRLREEISEEVVGKYGFVRERDAVQFLIDNLAGDVEIDGDVDSSATDDVAASVGAAIDGDEATELEAVSYVESDEADDDDPADEIDESVDPSDDGGSDGDDPADSDESEADAGAAGADEDDGSEDDADGDDGAADDDDMLNEMMSLLDTHDDKWEESSSADYRYSVTLPDGSVEEVQTKDDVRALLFKNYR
ncbi:hypothetical protein [Halosolutus gelatinilyticus]|uniref:hypothetical protein n=1 Tax=Halosolutus gelatinilyticus TaxID=2931975 RepID=UPI001FF2080C|nr:hypothetical protein [Halosolutus gelatinilyticus]